MTRAGTGSKATFTIRIHESGGFDIVLDHSSGQSAMNTDGTVGVEDFFGTNGHNLQSAPTTQFPDLTTDALDDYIYQYYYGTQHTYDLSVLTTDMKPSLAA